MTNKEIKEICIEEQTKQGCENYPKYKFRIIQTATKVKVYWEYLDGKCWTIDKRDLIVKNEHNEFMNDYFDYNRTLEETIKSCVYYMVNRY